MRREYLSQELEFRAIRIPHQRRELKEVLRGLLTWSRLWLLVVVWLCVVYFLVNIRLPKVLPTSVSISFAQPLAWTSLAVLAYMGWRYGLDNPPRINKPLMIMAILVGAFQIAVFVIFGLYLGFGRSPYAHQGLALFGNLIHSGSLLIGMEMARAYLAVVLDRRNSFLTLLLMTTLFTFVGYPAIRLTTLNAADSLFHPIGEELLPAFSENLFSTLLVLLGGPVASLIYRGVVETFELLAPILPKLPWMITAFVGTVIPILGMLVVRSQFVADYKEDEDIRSQDQASSTAWILVAIVGITLLWFNTGLFGIRPSLVSGVSMEPALSAGDIVITRDVSPASIVVGDIVRYRHGESYILHRVITIEDEGGEIQFITQGDANNVLDQPVTGEKLEGKVVLTLPKVGWVSIGLRRLISWFR